MPDGKGRGIARHIQKNIFIFKTLQKMVIKFGQFKKPGPFFTFQLFKLSQLYYQFLQSFENKNIFF